MARVDRRTVDLSAYPDLVVVYLGMRVNAFYGLKRLLGLGPQIADSVKARPDGLLLHESFLFSMFPLHAGMRQYWRDYESLERWTRSRAPPRVVEEVPARLRRHRLLARNLRPARRHRSHL